MLARLCKVKNEVTALIDSSGGNELLDKLKVEVEKIYKKNPFEEMLEINLDHITGFDYLTNRCELIFNNSLQTNINGVEVVGSYLRYKLEEEYVFCLYDKSTNTLKIKI